MADDSPRTRYEHARERLREKTESGEIAAADTEEILAFLDAKDEQKVNVHPGYDSEGDALGIFKPSTLRSYCNRLGLLARRAEMPLTEMSAADVNAFTQSLYDGTHPDVKDDGLSQNTVCNRQGTLRTFYEWAEFGPEKSDIVMLDPEDSNVDERDVLDKDDIEAMRAEITHPRDRALFEMLIYTGQRITALRTLRLKDVDVQEGVFWLNEEADGLKDAEKNGGKRPLLGSKKAVREWKEYHPRSDDPDAPLFVPKRKTRGSFDEPLGRTTVWRMLRDIRDSAGINKPCNPHNFRHTFVTLAKREYDIDDATIKYLIGHAPDSKVMETTYQHLSSEDHIRESETGFGIREEEEQSTLTPPVCPTCDEPLSDGAKACSACGTMFTPDAKAAQDQIKSTVHDAKEEAESLDEHKDLDKLERLIDENPELIDVLESMAEE